MQRGRNLSLIGPQKDFPHIKRRIPKVLFDPVELPLHDLRHAWKNVHVLDRYNGKPHSFAANEARAFRNIGHSQVAVDQFAGIEASDARFEFGISLQGSSKRISDAIHRQIIVRRSDTTCGKNIIVGIGIRSYLERNKLQIIGNDGDFADIDSKVAQFTNEVRRVFIASFSRQDFVTDDDDSGCFGHFLGIRPVRRFHDTFDQYSMPKTTTDARLIYSASDIDSNMLWATRFFAPDPFIFITTRGKRYLVMNDLEIDRAKSQASVDKVLSYSQYQKRWQSRGVQFPTTAQVLTQVFADLKIKSVEVPSTFPVYLADQLRKVRIRVQPKPDPFWPEREFKTKDEVRAISHSLRAAEIGMEAGIDAVRRTEIRKGYLYLNGTQLTSEILKTIINTAIMAQGYVPSHTIVASGEQCVDPHNQGSGPIRANTSIIMDIFPRSQRTGYFGDITRTIVRGHASERLKHAYDCVLKGQDIGFRRIRDGANAYDIHFEIVNYFDTEGFRTGPMNGRMQGFFHGTGHGLGLDIHEAPSFGQRSKNALRTGHVVTVEPGLYYEGMGGVRLEDVVVVTKTGCRNLVEIPKFLEV